MKFASFLLTVLVILGVVGLPVAAQEDSPHQVITAENVSQLGVLATLPRDNITAYNFSPDSRYFVTGDSIGNVALWEINSGDLVSEVQGHSADIDSVTFSADGSMLASGSKDHSVRLWNADLSESQLLEAHSEIVRDIAFSPDGTLLASGGLDGKISVWDTASASLLQAFDSGLGQVWSVTFHPSGSLLAASGYASQINVFRVATGTQVYSLEEKATSLAFSPDGTLLAASCYQGGEVAVWTTADWEPVFESGEHVYWMSDVAFSPDGSLLATGAHDGLVEFWNPATGEKLHEIQQHYGNAQVLFSPDGTLLAVNELSTAGGGHSPQILTVGGAPDQPNFSEPLVEALETAEAAINTTLHESFTFPSGVTFHYPTGWELSQNLGIQVAVLTGSDQFLIAFVADFSPDADMQSFEAVHERLGGYIQTDMFEFSIPSEQFERIDLDGREVEFYHFTGHTFLAGQVLGIGGNFYIVPFSNGHFGYLFGFTITDFSGGLDGIATAQLRAIAASLDAP